jgi:hypothetical protein
MLSKIKVDINSKLEDIKKIFNEFCDEFKKYPDILVETSDCEKYEFIYIFMDYNETNFFINLLLHNKIPIIEKSDFTNDFKEIIINDKIDKFKEKIIDFGNFDEVLEIFYNNYIITDDILDKICYKGINSLNDLDKNILKY